MPHSWAVTGCTDNREFLTGAMSLSFGSNFSGERHRDWEAVHGLHVDDTS
jgi:hypothetical protein